MKSNNSLNLIPDRRVLVTTKAVLGAGSPSGSEKNPDRQSVGPGSLCAQLVPAGGEDYFFFFCVCGDICLCRERVEQLFCNRFGVNLLAAGQSHLISSLGAQQR